LYVQILPLGAHLGAIKALDVCTQRSLVLTAGIDRTARVWDPRSHRCLQSTTFTDVPVGVALHPMGFQALIAFKGHIALFHIMRGALRQSHELPVMGATHLVYSHAGAMFAYATGTLVHYYDAITFELLGQLTYATSPIFRLAWSPDDRVLLTATMDGFVSVFAVDDRTRVMDLCVKHIRQEDVVVSWSAKTGASLPPKCVIGFGSDRIMRVFTYSVRCLLTFRILISRDGGVGFQ
jgi:WD40 repeat protein